jgi:hypothetical protein
MFINLQVYGHYHRNQPQRKSQSQIPLASSTSNLSCCVTTLVEITLLQSALQTVGAAVKTLKNYLEDYT